MIVSRLCDTSFESRIRHKKNIWQMCSPLVLLTQSVYIKKIHFKLFLEQKIFLVFWNLEHLKVYKYHVSVILSQRRDTLYISRLTKYHTDMIVSLLCDSITQTWFGPNWPTNPPEKYQNRSKQDLSLKCSAWTGFIPRLKWKSPNP